MKDQGCVRESETIDGIGRIANIPVLCSITILRGTLPGGFVLQQLTYGSGCKNHKGSVYGGTPHFPIF